MTHNYIFRIRRTDPVKKDRNGKKVFVEGAYHVNYQQDALEAFASEFPQYADEALRLPRFDKTIRVFDPFNKSWIIDRAIEDIMPQYERGELTLRGLHYRLVTEYLMTNDLQHYKRVVEAMSYARWERMVPYGYFVDPGRYMEGETQYAHTDLDEEIEKGKYQIEAWMNNFRRNYWEGQERYVEVIIEKQAMLPTFEKVCAKNHLTLGACKGYPGITWISEMATRMQEAQINDRAVTILYFGDYDPSGDDIPRVLVQGLNKMGVMDVELRRIILTEEQVREWNLPPAPAKLTDSRTANWDGLGQVEMDAVAPPKMKEILQDAIDDVFDDEVYENLIDEEDDQRETYRAELLEFVNNL